MDSALSTRDGKCEPTLQVQKRDLSRDCMQLLELMQRVNFGRIEGLRVVNGEPVLSSIKSARSVHKLKGESGPRPELGIADFSLKQEVCELFRLIERVGNGELDLIEIKHGLPFIVELNVRGTDGESCELYQLLRQEDQDRRLCRKTARSDEERASIRMDLSSAIQKLPPVCQEIVRRLRTQNVSEISREMGIPRTTINDWLRQIRQQFDDAGLRAYLEE